MRFFARTTWIFTFMLATYSWMVAFEHGFAWKNFSDGFKVEWSNVGSLLMGKGSQPDAIRPTAQTSQK